MSPFLHSLHSSLSFLLYNNDKIYYRIIKETDHNNTDVISRSGGEWNDGVRMSPGALLR